MLIKVSNTFSGSILDYLKENNVYVPAACGGRGVCGKCKVKVREAGVSVFHGVLACGTPVFDGMEIEADTAAENEFKALDIYSPQRETVYDRTDNPGYGAAVDVGTTTLAFELREISTGRRVNVHSAVNRQRALGADVITRIEAAVGGKRSELQRIIVEDISGGIKKLVDGVTGRSALNSVVITGNTTMLHLLRGYPCETLASYPFTPFSVSMEKHSRRWMDVTVLPGISSFVGADITAGIVFCGFPEGNGFDLLIDLGTNGEIALFSKEKIFVTSAAAGPAFEAANISCGTGSVPGAVAKVTYLSAARVYSYETIGGGPPVGLCGTGVVDVAAELNAYGIIDETGLLSSEYFESGVMIAPDVVFTQKDVREVQLAKSAVRTGVEILLSEAGVGYDAINRVYIAGGFGHKINVRNAAAIGIIPNELAGKVRAVGNSALGGAVRVLLSREAENEVLSVASKARDINLSAHPMFNDLFMKYMMF